jgi:hypothetical protein
MRLAGHEAHMGEMRNAYKMSVVIAEGKRPFGSPRCRWEIYEWILGKQGVKVWTGCIWLRTGTSDGLL